VYGSRDFDVGVLHDASTAPSTSSGGTGDSTGGSDGLRKWLSQECQKNTMLHNEQTLIPVVSEIGITERFRRQFDKSQLLTAFQKADDDGSGFLEEDELLKLINGDLLGEMADGENKVHQVIHQVVHKRCIGYVPSGIGRDT